jgi:hypothetical protein
MYRAHRRLIGPRWLFLISGLIFETALSAYVAHPLLHEM